MSYSLAIVTICFNNLQELKRTIQSVDEQKLLPFEHIIIDGSTTTEIQDHLKSSNIPAYRKWTSEPDEGISDAFNKGIRIATGAIIHILNSGDLYYDKHTTQRVLNTFESDTSIKWTHGQYVQEMGGNWIVTGKQFDRKELYRGMHKVGHPTMFLKKELYDQHGLFDISLKYAMDYDLLVRISQEKFKYIPEPLIIFTPGGLSNQQRIKAFNEIGAIYKRYFKPSFEFYYWRYRMLLFYQLVDTWLGSKLLALKHQKNLAKGLKQ
jgi:GT2 family glycosyltransferase